ncbi:MAG TPA: hypothetical protein DCR24_08925 [Bacillus bacterium]|nr:hypothetical protein [Bacillus sp. (in: firmicutes)]
MLGYQHAGDTNTMTMYMRKLREKIEPHPLTPVFLKTVWGIGCLFLPRQEAILERTFPFTVNSP